MSISGLDKSLDELSFHYFDIFVSKFSVQKRIRHLQHGHFSAKNNDMSHKIAYTTHHISYIYCIRLDTKFHISWVYCHVIRSWKVVYCRIYYFWFSDWNKVIFSGIPKRMVDGRFLITPPPSKHYMTPQHFVIIVIFLVWVFRSVWFLQKYNFSLVLFYLIILPWVMIMFI